MESPKPRYLTQTGRWECSHCLQRFMTLIDTKRHINMRHANKEVKRTLHELRQLKEKKKGFKGI